MDVKVVFSLIIKEELRCRNKGAQNKSLLLVNHSFLKILSLRKCFGELEASGGSEGKCEREGIDVTQKEEGGRRKKPPVCSVTTCWVCVGAGLNQKVFTLTGNTGGIAGKSE
ncbi:hypothetical protein AVEN_229940-1 [Araneus ventricosus]|uniref:Uncharacterized protein n=1 Tax=Araneus ventricosus TaxID=182803 RepID=A0A4Y2BYE7_ARAVE|nr:hypothetical protein AVEN_229940-1 [Araneus ventricosus]